MLSQLLVKLSRGETLTPAEQETMRLEAQRLEQTASLVASWVVPGTSTPFIRNLRAENITIPSGEIQLGADDGTGFSGVRIAYPAFTHDASDWNLAGFDAGVLQVGFRASDGKLVAGGGGVVIDQNGMVAGNGNVTIDEFGISIPNDTEGLFSIDNIDNVRGKIFAVVDADDSFHFVNRSRAADPLGGIVFEVQLNEDTGLTASGSGLAVEEDWNQDNRTRVRVLGGSQGTRLILDNDALIDMRTEGASGGSTFLRMRETTNTPPSPGAGDAYHLYIKDDKLIVQFNDGGTVRYKYLDLTGVGTTWSHTTTAP